MTPVWLIEADAFGRSFEPLKAEIRQQGMAWEVVQSRPLLNGVTPAVGGHRLGDGECVVFSGSYPLMRHIQLNHRWAPGGWCAAENFDCRRYYPHFGRHLLNQSHTALPVEEALSRRDELFAVFARDGEVFVRPCGVEKTFTGRRADREAFDLTLGSARYAAGWVLVASPRPIEREWRAVASGGRLIAASQYSSGGAPDVEPGCPREVRAYVEALLAEVPYRPDPIYVLDVCASGAGLYLVELNSFSCSGLYACDPGAVVGEVRRLAVEAWRAARAAG